MEMRMFGRTGMRFSVLGFGCGAVVQYGNGESEKNLGRVLQRLKPANVTVGTKVRLPSGDFGRIAAAVAKSLGSPAARCPAQPSVIRLRVCRLSRSARL